MGCLARLAELAWHSLSPDILEDTHAILNAASRVSDLGGHPILVSLSSEDLRTKPSTLSPHPLPIAAARQIVAMFGGVNR